MKRSARAHIVAFLAAVLTFIVVCVLWLFNLRLGPPPSGLVGGATFIFVPFTVLVLSAIWFFIRAAMHGRMRWRVISVLAVTLLIPLVIVTIYCGPVACYPPGPPNHMMGFFIIFGVALVALVHHFVLNSYPTVDNAPESV